MHLSILLISIPSLVRPQLNDERCPVASQRWPPPPVICYDRTQEKPRTTWIWSNLNDRTQEKPRTTWIWSNLMTLENLFTNQDASLRWIWVISVLSEYLTKFKAKIVLNCL